jgi:hypothetical protein
MMDDYDAKLFTQFLRRTGMYVSPITRDNITSFMIGYEIGSRNKCEFTDLIYQKLEEQYHFKSNSWPDQVNQYAIAETLDWVQAFLTIATEVLNEHSTPEQRIIIFPCGT